MIQSHPEALDRLYATAAAVVAARMTPPPELSVSEWADQYRMLSREASAEPGRWRTARAPYLKGILDACSDPAIEHVVCELPSQFGKTEVELNVLGFYMHQDPAPILVVLPTIGDAEQWSKTRLATMIRDTPELAQRVQSPRSRDSGNTLLVKEYPGGHVTLVGSNAPSGLSAKPIRVVLRDEVDRFARSAGSEGDPITLSTRRTTTFWNRKLIDVSSPTLANTSPDAQDGSRIHQMFLEGDQRRYLVPCPHCGHPQPLEWPRLRWEPGVPSGAQYWCRACEVPIRERQKMAMVRAGQWRATVVPTKPRVASFHANALISVWVTWADLAAEWEAAQHDLTRLQVFVNTVLAECWEERRGAMSADTLSGRTIMPTAEVPAPVGLLTCGVDVQADRLEAVVRGWGAGRASWGIRREILLGDAKDVSSALSPWRALDVFLARSWGREDGTTLTVQTACIDSGYATDEVYAFCKARFARRIFATKGSSQYGQPIVGRRPRANNKARVRLFLVGTDTAKDTVHAMLKVTQEGPMCWHWCGPTFDADYFDQLTAEAPIRRQVSGRWRRRWELPRGKRSEALDCEVLNLVALTLSGITTDGLAARGGALVGALPDEVVSAPEEMPDLAPSAPRRPTRRRPWAQRF